MNLFVPIFGTIDPSRYLGYDPGGAGLAKFIANTIDAVFIIAGLAFFIYFAVGGFRYITSSGDVKQTQEASKQITQAVTGLAIVIASYGVTSILGNILGIPIFKPVFVGP